MDIDRRILLQAVSKAASQSKSDYLANLADDIANGRAAKIDTWLALDAIWIALKTEHTVLGPKT